MNSTRLPLKTMLNTRDLGGIPLEGGRVMKWRKFLRAASPVDLNQEEQDFLVNTYGVSLVLDLRTPPELVQHANPFMQDGRVKFLNLSFLSHLVIEEDIKLDEMYCQILNNSKPLILEAFNAIDAANGNGCTLYHCSAGKDRTGLLSALILGMCGADECDIIANYQISFTYIKPMFDKLREEIGELPQNGIGSNPEYIQHTLEHIKQNYTSIPEYLKQIGVDKAMQARLAERFTEKLVF